MKIAVYISIVYCFFITACSKGGGANGNNGNPPPSFPSPEATTLISPINNAACLSGISLDSNITTISFSWQAATNAESYDLVIKNLISTQQTTYSATSTSKDIELSKTQPYSWYVLSKSSKTTTTRKSAVWKFYVAGTPASSYAPFPATIITPIDNSMVASGGASQVNIVLQWDATDIDNDIVSYAIYLDNKDASTQINSLIATKTTTLSLASGMSYYWRVVTIDAAGNSSDSGPYFFTIQ